MVLDCNAVYRYSVSSQISFPFNGVADSYNAEKNVQHGRTGHQSCSSDGR